MTYADGTTLNDTAGFTASGLLGSDGISSVTLASNAIVSGSGNWNAGTWAITPSAASGSGLGNYTITYAAGSQSIAAKAVTLAGIAANGKVYDATTGDALNTSAAVAGKVSGDNLTIGNGSGSFADANVGTTTVTATGFSLIGADASGFTPRSVSLVRSPPPSHPLSSPSLPIPQTRLTARQTLFLLISMPGW